MTVDSQNRVLVVHRGNDSLEGNEKGMIPAVGRGGVPGLPSSSVCCMSAPVVLEYDAAGKFVERLGRSELDLRVAAGHRRYRRRRQRQCLDRGGGR